MDTAPERTIGSSLTSHVLTQGRGALAALVGFSIALNVIGFAGPIFSLQVFDRVLNARSETTLFFLFALTVSLLALQAFIEGVRLRLLIRIGNRFDDALAPRVFSRMVAAGNLFPRQTDHANSIRHLDQIRECFAGAPALAILDAPWIPLYVAACFLFHPLIGWAVVACGLALVGLAGMGAMLTGTPLRHAQVCAQTAATQAASAHRQADIVRSLGMLDALRGRWMDIRDASLGWQGQAGDRTGMVVAASRFVRLLVPVAATGLGAWLVIHDEITPGILIASSMLAARALLPIDQIVTSWRVIQGARLAWERLRKLDEASDRSSPCMALPRPSGRLEVMRLVVVHQGSSQPALRNVSFNLEQGEVLGVVGPCGSGKSTLARALVGAAPVLAGEIRLDGARLNQWDLDLLGPDLGYLPQDCSLFTGTIAENICRFRPGASSESVIEAARMAGAHEVILDLPRGYDTLIGDSGQGLSGGQRQQIALARAVYGDPRLVVLDEPNAALDGRGETALLNAIAELRKRQRTVVIMTHRLGVLAAADKLLIIEHGQVRAFGPRDHVITAVNADAADSSRQRPAMLQRGKS